MIKTELLFYLRILTFSLRKFPQKVKQTPKKLNPKSRLINLVLY